jgi:uncharacterized protein YkwD
MFTTLAVTTCLMFAVPGDASPTQSVAEDLHPVELALVEKTNAERRRNGLRPLRLDRQLLRSARRHAAWMSRSHTLQHTSLPVAENIAMGQRTTSEAVQSWMNSPGHRANMLNAGYSRVGAAAYTASSGQIFWCIQFLQ